MHNLSVQNLENSSDGNTPLHRCLFRYHKTYYIVKLTKTSLQAACTRLFSQAIELIIITITITMLVMLIGMSGVHFSLLPYE